jgi:hypothetical protein
MKKEEEQAFSSTSRGVVTVTAKKTKLTFWG